MNMLRLCVLLLLAVVCVHSTTLTFDYATVGQNVVKWVVPSGVTVVNIYGYGGSGGSGGVVNNNFRYGGRPMSVNADFAVTPGTVLNILVGQRGTSSSNANLGGGGGGGSFVYNSATGSVLLAAGGGGGGGLSYNGYDGQSTDYGYPDSSGWGQPGYNGADSQANQGNGQYNVYRAKGFLSIVTSPAIGSYANYPGGWPGATGNWNQNGGGASGYSAGGGPSNYQGYYSGGGGGGSIANGGVRTSFATYDNYNTDGFVRITYGYAFKAANYNTWFCGSGYTGTYCDQPVTNCSTIQPTKTVGTIAPNVQSVTYANNNLKVVLEAPFVLGRYYKQATIEGTSSAATACNYVVSTGGSTYWTAAQSGCKDTLTFIMPWTAKATCGFTNSTPGDDWWRYRGKAIVNYEELVGNFSGADMWRKAQHQYTINVAFPRFITVTVTNIQISSDVSFDIALTKDIYSSTTGELTVEFTSALQWSSWFRATAMNVTVPDDSIYISTPVAVDNSGCGSVSGSVCYQKISFGVKLTNTSTCSFDGAYQLDTMIVGCRDVNDTNCPATPATVTFYLASGSVCPQAGVALTLDGTLASYSSSSFGTTKTAYTLGDRVFFLFTPSVGTGNTVTIKFLDIAFSDNANPGNQYLMLNGVKQVSGNLVSLDPQAGSRYFSFYFTGQVFRQTLGTVQSYTISVKIEVTFNGNKKRIVEHTINSDDVSTQAASSIVHLHPGAQLSSAPASEIVEADNAAAASMTYQMVIAVLGVALIASVVVFAVIIHRIKRISNQPATAALL